MPETIQKKAPLRSGSPENRKKPTNTTQAAPPRKGSPTSERKPETPEEKELRQQMVNVSKRQEEPFVFNHKGKQSRGVRRLTDPLGTGISRQAHMPGRDGGVRKFIESLTTYFDAGSSKVANYNNDIRKMLRKAGLVGQNQVADLPVADPRPKMYFQYKQEKMPSEKEMENTLKEYGIKFPKEHIFIWNSNDMDRIVRVDVPIVSWGFDEDLGETEPLTIISVANLPLMTLQTKVDYQINPVPMKLSVDSHPWGNLDVIEPSKSPKFNPMLNAIGPEVGMLNIAYLLQKDGIVGNLFNQIMDIAAENFFGNGTPSSSMRRERIVYTKSLIRTQAISFLETYHEKYDQYYFHTYGVYGEDRGGNHHMSHMQMFQLLNKAWPRTEPIPGLGKKAVYRLPDDSYDESFIWAPDSPTLIASLLFEEEFYNGYNVNMHSSSGICSGNRPREETHFQEAATATLFIKGRARLEGPLAAFRLGCLKPKMEVQKKSKLETGTRNYTVMPAAAQIPMGLFYNAVFETLPNYCDDGDYTGPSLLGLHLYGGGTHRLIMKFLRQMDEDKSRINIFTSYSDNTYVVVRETHERGTDIMVLSLDGEKMESSHSMHTTNGYIHWGLSQLGHQPLYSKGNKKGNLNPDQGIMSGIGQKHLLSDKPVNDLGVNLRLLEFISNNGAALACDLTVLYGQLQFVHNGLTTGTQGTAQLNQCQTLTALMAAIEHGVERKNVFKELRPPTLLDQSKWPYVHPGPYYGKDDFRLTSDVNSAFYMMGMSMQPEFGVPSLMEKLSTGLVVQLDLLGHSVMAMQVLGDTYIVPVLDRQRLLKALTFSKVESKGFSGLDKDFVALGKAKCLALVGGLAYPDIAKLITSYMGTKVRQIAQYIEQSSQSLSSTRELNKQAIRQLSQSLGEDLNPLFGGVTSITALLSAPGMPTTYDYISVMLDEEPEEGEKKLSTLFAESTLKAYAEKEIDDYGLIAAVPAKYIAKAISDGLLPETRAFNDLAELHMLHVDVAQFVKSEAMKQDEIDRLVDLANKAQVSQKSQENLTESKPKEVVSSKAVVPKTSKVAAPRKAHEYPTKVEALKDLKFSERTPFNPESRDETIAELIREVQETGIDLSSMDGMKSVAHALKEVVKIVASKGKIGSPKLGMEEVKNLGGSEIAKGIDLRFDGVTRTLQYKNAMKGTLELV